MSQLTPQEKADRLRHIVVKSGHNEPKATELFARFFELLEAARNMPQSYGDRHGALLGEKLDEAIAAVKAALPEELR